MSSEKLVKLYYTLIKTIYNHSKISFTLFKSSLNAFMINAELENDVLAPVCNIEDDC